MKSTRKKHAAFIYKPKLGTETERVRASSKALANYHDQISELALKNDAPIAADHTVLKLFREISLARQSERSAWMQLTKHLSEQRADKKRTV